MRHLRFTGKEQPNYPICILAATLSKDAMRKEYVDAFGLAPEEVFALDLHQAEGKKKTPVAEIKRYIAEELVPVWTDMGVEYLVVADAEYFKVLTKAAKADANLGYVMDCEFGPWKVVFVPTYRQIFYDPEKVRGKIAQGMEAMQAHRAGVYEAPGSTIIHYAAYPTTPEEIEDWLIRLIEEDRPLTCDIEGFGLKHYDAGIGTISFCWSKNEGIAFPVDLTVNPELPLLPGVPRDPAEAQLIRRMLKAFFAQFTNRLMFHKIDYDVYVLIYQLFMADILDTEGLLEGLEVMLRNWDCTRIITYLATNSCAGNRLGLKDQSQEFSGNYAVLGDDPDITKIPLPELLKYNLIDGLSTWYVYEKHWDTLVQDNQLEVYRDLFQPALVDIIQMQLTGMPVDMDQVRRTKKILQADYDRAVGVMQGSPIIQRFNYRLVEKWVAEMNATWKKKRTTVTEMLELIKTDDKRRAEVTFNPNSGPQLQDLLFEMLQLPVISHTDTKQPSTDGDTFKALLNHTKDPEILTFLEAMIDYSTVNKILTSFVPALERSLKGPDGWHYMFGCFNIGGTISGRLSSSEPNLQNIPANGKNAKAKEYAKLIKACFAAPPGWIFCGLDFASLEDRISALTTKDPNKLKVYTDGYDGHSLRAYAYFGDQMPDIDYNSVASINSIEFKYKPLRQESKAPTFALTYQGTWITLVTNCGFDKEKALLVEKRYHEMYVVSDQWVADKLDEASRTGYVTVAFGLRLRTPKLAQVIRGTSKTPYEAEAEGRSAGNALGQSWCLLNSRAWSETMGKVRKSTYRTMIRPCAQIHDAGYALVKEDMGALLYLNEHLVKAVQWQEHPDIAHDEVKLGGELSIFHPNWATEIGIPNGASENDIYDIIEQKFAAAA